MVTGMVSEGIQDLLIQYLQLKMNFRVKDQARAQGDWRSFSVVEQARACD
jgi:hypothetical protein